MLFSHRRGQVHTLRPSRELATFHEGTPTPPPAPSSSGSFQILSQSPLTCLLLEPRAKACRPGCDTGEGPPCFVCPRALCTTDQDVPLEEYAFRLVLALGQCLLSEDGFPLGLFLDTHSCLPSLACRVFLEFCRKHKP